MTTAYDTKLTLVPNLKWLPWVGSKYNEQAPGNRLLIVGESHYYNPGEHNSLEKHLSPHYTRTAITLTAIGREYRTYENGAAKIFPNLHRTLFANDRFEAAALWQNVAFYNFIQHPMCTNNGRPKGELFAEGWDVFQRIISILKPDTVLFLGNSAAHHFPGTFTTGIKQVQSLHVNWRKNKTLSRVAALSLSCGQQVQLQFVRHPSRYYSWSLWRSYLEQHQPSLMQWAKSLPV